jgi:hypothetical protein
VLLFIDKVPQLVVSRTECNSGTVEKLPFRINTSTELKNVTITSDSNDIWRCMLQLTSVLAL